MTDRIPAVMGARGQVVIPQRNRDQLCLAKGDLIWLTVERRKPEDAGKYPVTEEG